MIAVSKATSEMDWLVKLLIICGLLNSSSCIVKRQATTQGVSPDILTNYPNGAFDDKKPPPDPNNQQFKDYVGVLTRFDDWATGKTHVRGPQDVLPDDEINDPKPQVDPNNQAYKDYVNELTRFDAWVTGHKVPIPADPVTDALHQDVGDDHPAIRNTRSGNSGEKSGNPNTIDFGEDVVEFNDSSPTGTPIPAYNDYVKELTRFDSWITGKKVPIPTDPQTDALHQVFRRSVISSKENFADQFSVTTPDDPTSNPKYNDFVKELKRFDPWITGQKVPIPKNPSTDALHSIKERAIPGSRN